jgi:PAS domain S-box-containing protein
MIQTLAEDLAEGDTPISSEAKELALRAFLATSGQIGEGFLSRLPAALASELGVHGVYVCEVAFDRERVYPVVTWSDDKSVERPDHFGESSVVSVLIEQGSAAHERSAADLYPDDQVLAELKAEALAGAVLRSDSGDALGALLLIHRQPLPECETIKRALELFAPRAAAELQRHQQDVALRRSESRLRFLAERSKDMLFYYQVLPDPRLQWVSPAAEEIFGYPPEAFHANPELVLQLVDPEDRSTFASALVSGSEEPLVARVRRSDGNYRWVEYRDFSVFDAERRLSGIGGTVRDITRRIEVEQSVRASEEYVRALLSAMPETLLRVAADGKILDYVAGEVSVGQGGQNQVIGRNYKELLSLAVVGVLDRTIRAAVRSGRPQRVEMELPGDQHKFYEARCLPFSDGEVLVVLRDLTAKRWHEGEEERQRLRDEIDTRIEHKTRSNPYALTYREIAVLHLVVEGMADKQIADALGISIYTVNKHVGNILGKMNAASRTEAGVRAVKEGLLGLKQD